MGTLCVTPSYLHLHFATLCVHFALLLRCIEHFLHLFTVHPAPAVQIKSLTHLPPATAGAAVPLHTTSRTFPSELYITSTDHSYIGLGPLHHLFPVSFLVHTADTMQAADSKILLLLLILSFVLVAVFTTAWARVSIHLHIFSIHVHYLEHTCI